MINESIVDSLQTPSSFYYCIIKPIYNNARKCEYFKFEYSLKLGEVGLGIKTKMNTNISLFCAFSGYLYFFSNINRQKRNKTVSLPRKQ